MSENEEKRLNNMKERLSWMEKRKKDDWRKKCKERNGKKKRIEKEMEIERSGNIEIKKMIKRN